MKRNIVLVMLIAIFGCGMYFLRQSPKSDEYDKNITSAAGKTRGSSSEAVVFPPVASSASKRQPKDAPGWSYSLRKPVEPVADNISAYKRSAAHSQEYLRALYSDISYCAAHALNADDLAASVKAGSRDETLLLSLKKSIAEGENVCRLVSRADLRVRQQVLKDLLARDATDKEAMNAYFRIGPNGTAPVIYPELEGVEIKAWYQESMAFLARAAALGDFEAIGTLARLHLDRSLPAAAYIRQDPSLGLTWGYTEILWLQANTGQQGASESLWRKYISMSELSPMEISAAMERGRIQFDSCCRLQKSDGS
jgi:hypothetical protein